MYLIRTDIKESPIEGKGYFASEDVPLGTLVYFYSDADKRFTPSEFGSLSEVEQNRLREFAVEDEFGNWVETATGPHTNHSCDSNILPLFIDGYYTSIAVKNIALGDEITTDYSQFFSSFKWSMDCNCRSALCRHSIGYGLDHDPNLEIFWQDKLARAVANIAKVSQPITKSHDSYAKKISSALLGKHSPTLAKQIKFSIINGS